MIQYGFVTLFIAAFPLAPLFALINNIFEIRIDADKLITTKQRPIGERAQDIGAWFSILKAITYLSVVTNVRQFSNVKRDSNESKLQNYLPFNLLWLKSFHL